MNAQVAAVDFHGNPLTVITTDDNQRLVAMRPICEGIGLNWQGQHDRMRRHEVLNSVVRVTRMTAADGKQYQYVCLPLDYLNGWLFGIDAKRVRPEIRSRLIQYQRECFRVLSDYWTGDKPVSASHDLPRLESRQALSDWIADIEKTIRSYGNKAPCPDLPSLTDAVIDGLIYDHIIGSRWLVSLNHQGKMDLCRVPSDNRLVSPSDKRQVLSLIDEGVLCDMLPDVIKVAANRISRIGLS